MPYFVKNTAVLGGKYAQTTGYYDMEILIPGIDKNLPCQYCGKIIHKFPSGFLYNYGFLDDYVFDCYNKYMKRIEALSSF